MKYIIYICMYCITLCIYSCNNKEDIKNVLLQWNNKKIKFPNMVFTKNVTDTVNYNTDGVCKILTYNDSVGCTPCTMKFLEWQLFMNHVDSITDFSVPFIFVVLPKDIRDFCNIQKSYGFVHPVFIDIHDSVNLLNQFPKDVHLRTFLLDKDDKVIIVGNPVYNNSIRELYIEKIKSLVHSE